MRPTLRFLAATLSLASALLAACGTGEDDGTAAAAPAADPPPSAVASYTLSVAPAALAVGAGQDAWLEVTIRRDTGFDQPVRVQLEHPDAGIVADSILIPASQDRANLSIRIAADLPVGGVHALSVTGAGDSATHAASSQLTIKTPEATSQQLVDSARSAGTIGEGTALLYRAYALLGDRRLPDAYLGAGSAEEDNALFVQIARRLSSLPAADQAALLPFLVRPADARSVWNATATPTAARSGPQGAAPQAITPATCAASAQTAGTWISKRSAAHPVRAWTQCTGGAAHDAASEALLDSMLVVLDKIYLPMTSLMGPPQLDTGGGDSAIDIYLPDDGVYVWRRDAAWQPRGLGTTYDDEAERVVGNGRGNSGFIVMPRSVAYGARFHPTLIHEFFHVLQKAHNADYAHDANGASHWFVEASAAWASAHFDRTEAPWPNGRGAYVDAHQRFKTYFLPSFDALNASGSPHDYSAYIWPYFVEQETGSAAFMATIWSAIENASTFDDADQAIDRVFSFAANFKRFALRNLNSELLPGDPLPRARRYVSLDPDQFADDKVPPPVPEAALVAGRDVAQQLTLKNASARYLRLTVDGGATPVISKVVVDTTALASQDKVDIQALVLTSAGWLPQPIDIGADGATFCFDNGQTTADVRGSFVQLLLIVSNHAIARGADVTGALTVQPSAQPCATVWEGTVEEVAQVDDVYQGGSFRRAITSTAHLSFELDANAADLRHVFRLRAGDFSYRETRDRVDVGNTCHAVVTASGPLHRQASLVDTSDGASEGTLYTYESAADPLPQYALGDTIETFSAYATATTVGHCTLEGDSTSVEHGFFMALWQTHALHDITEGGTAIRGTYAYNNGAGTTTYTYLLRRTQR